MRDAIVVLLISKNIVGNKNVHSGDIGKVVYKKPVYNTDQQH